MKPLITTTLDCYSPARVIKTKSKEETAMRRDPRDVDMFFLARQIAGTAKLPNMSKNKAWRKLQRAEKLSCLQDVVTLQSK